jgi:hypothetical protein
MRFTLGDSMKLVNTLVTALGLLALANVAQAAVITTVEWESKPGAPWSYASGTFGTGATIDCAMPPSPSGGCALRMLYPAGTYSSSFGAGRAEYDLSGEPTDLYVGAWMRYSDPFTFHPVGHKVNFFVLAGANPGCRNVAMGYISNILGMAPQICWGIGTHNYVQNVNAWYETAHLNEWHWYEEHIRVNTPGVADGIMQVWIDDVLYVEYSNVPFRNVGDTAGLGAIQHTGEWGGGGVVIRQTGYWWIDHTVISTTRIGHPAVGGDTTPPRPPTNFMAY